MSFGFISKFGALNPLGIVPVDFSMLAIAKSKFFEKFSLVVECILS